MCWNPSLQGEGFNTSLGALQMLLHKKIMFDHYYCIKSFCNGTILENIGENASNKFFFPVPNNAAEKHVTNERSKNAASRANDYVILMSQNYICWYIFACLLMMSDFVTAPGCIQLKPHSNSMFIALLKYGFAPVKTSVNRMWHRLLCDNII